MILSLDVGKEKSYYAISKEEIEIIEEGEIKKKQYKEKLRNLIDKYKIKEVIMEHTGLFSIHIYSIIKNIDDSVKIYFVDSSLSDKVRKLFFKSKKNDKLDAKILLKVINFQDFIELYEIGKLEMEILFLVRQHKIISRQLAEVKKIIKLDEDITTNEYLKELQEILEKKKKNIEKEIKNKLKKTFYEQIIKNVDGINYVSMAYFIAYIKNIKRFPTVWKFLAYCGVAPITYSSGKFNVKRTTSKVNKELKRILYMAAIGLLRNPKYREIYDKKIKEGKHHFVAITHIMKRVARNLYKEWKKIVNNEQKF